MAKKCEGSCCPYCGEKGYQYTVQIRATILGIFGQGGEERVDEEVISRPRKTAVCCQCERRIDLRTARTGGDR